MERRKKTDDDENGLLYADGTGSCGTDHWKQRAVDRHLLPLLSEKLFGMKLEPVEKASVLEQLKEKQEAVPPAPPRRCCEEKEL